MKTIPVLLKLVLVLCCTFATAVAFGQATVTWTGAGDGTNISSAANWGGTLPVPNNGDTAQFDGVVPGNLVLSYVSGLSGAFNDVNSLTWALTANQTGSVTFTTPATDSTYLNMGNINVATGAGAFTLGPTDPTKKLWLIARPTSAVHVWNNDSSNPVTFTGRIQWGSQGGAFWTAQFSGAGDFDVNNYLVNNNGGNNLIVVNGPGTVFWNPGGFLGVNSIGTPITINGGKLVLMAQHPRLNNQQIGNGTIFEFNAPGFAQTLSGNITGPGELRVSNGTLTLSGLNDYTGNTVLNGGQLVVNSAETEGVTGPLGIGGTISFGGGTLVYSLNNVFDYSGRFSTAAGQQYRIDTAGQNVTFTNTAGLSSSGGTLAKTNVGILTLAGPSTYTGATTVDGGKLVFQGSKTGTGNITVADGASLDVYATGTQVKPTALTLGAGAALEFDNVNSTTTEPIAAGTVSATGTLTVNVNSGTLTPANSYPLFSWSSGSAPAVNLGILSGFIGNLSTNGNSIVLNVTATAYRWTGNNNGSWDLSTPNNWEQNGAAVVFANGGPVLFNDSASGNTAITITGNLLPTSITVNNVNSNYSIASSTGNKVGGSASLTKTGSGTLTLSGGANDFTGVTAINNGIVSVGSLANGGAASDIGAATSDAVNLVLNGGTLQYTGAGASIDRSFTIGLSGGTIDASGAAPLNLNAASLGYSGPGARTLTLSGTGVSNTLGAVIANNGGATALTKSGTGSWVLTATNTYSGGTTVDGVLQVGNGGTSGSLGTGSVLDNGTITFNRAGTLTVSGAITGTGSVTNDGTGTVILAGNNGYTAGTFINAGTLQIGNGGASGTLAGTAQIVNNSLLIFNSSGSIVLNQFGSVISGTGNIIVRGTGLVNCSAANTYTGWTQVDPGATFMPFSENHGQLLSSVVTNNGTLFFTAQEFDPGIRGYTNNIVGTGKVVKDNNNQNAGWNILAGDNTYTGGTWIAGGGIQIGDGITPGRGSIVGPIIFTNTPTSFKNERVFIIDRPDTYTFTNPITSVVTDTPGDPGAQGRFLHRGTNSTVIITGNNSYPGSTTAYAGTLQVGDGGTSGSIGSGAINLVDVTAIFAFNRSDDVTLANGITGQGSFMKLGAGKLTLTGAGSYTGTTVVSNGTLVINGANAASSTFVFGGTLGGTGTLSGAVTMDVGTTLAPGASVGTLTINSTLDFSGNVTIEVDKSLVQSNDVVNALGGAVNNGSGTLTVVNVGPALAVGDRFVVFSQALANGASLNVTGAGATWQNDLALDGSITALTVPVVTPPTLSFTRSAGNLNFSWTQSGFKLQSQTNSLSVGLKSNWVDYPGGGASPVSVPIGVTDGAVFFRLAPTP